jgi:hypothetical protein
VRFIETLNCTDFRRCPESQCLHLHILPTRQLQVGWRRVPVQSRQYLPLDRWREDEEKHTDICQISDCLDPGESPAFMGHMFKTTNYRLPEDTWDKSFESVWTQSSSRTNTTMTNRGAELSRRSREGQTEGEGASYDFGRGWLTLVSPKTKRWNCSAKASNLGTTTLGRVGTLALFLILLSGAPLLPLISGFDVDVFLLFTFTV